MCRFKVTKCTSNYTIFHLEARQKDIDIHINDHLNSGWTKLIQIKLASLCFHGKLWVIHIKLLSWDTYRNTCIILYKRQQFRWTLQDFQKKIESQRICQTPARQFCGYEPNQKVCRSRFGSRRCSCRHPAKQTGVKDSRGLLDNWQPF